MEGKAERTEEPKGRKGSRQITSSRVVLRVENSPAYQKYKAEGPGLVSEYEFCDLLYCTLESMPETFEKNFSVVKQEVEKYGRQDLAAFLDEIKRKLPGNSLESVFEGG